ncbi:MAG: type II toxin-antitoxin system RatA family toxin, partial [Rhizobiales bacterium]|nr:type II toxin-antitoxin system RatA family toxin [Hyphomicrobiales bacterium]
MPSFATERRVGHSAEEMFALVADVEKYPQFVPLCERLVIRGR